MPMITAVLASKASISLKSVFSKPFTFIHFQFFPALVLFPTVPLLPLTHITLSFTTLKPRRLVLLPEVNTSTTGSCAKASAETSEKNKVRRRLSFFIVQGIRAKDKGFRAVFIGVSAIQAEEKTLFLTIILSTL